MTPRRQLALFAACAILVLLNVALLIRHSKLEANLAGLAEENATLRYKATLEVKEIYELFEHRLEGRSFSGPIAELRRADPRFDSLCTRNGGGKLLFYFPNLRTRQNLYMESRLLHEYRQKFPQRGMPSMWVFSGLKENEFESLTEEFRLSESAALDSGSLLQKSLNLSADPVILWLNEVDEVVFARVSRASDEEGSRRFYAKIGAVGSHVQDPQR